METRGLSGTPRRGWETRQKKRHTTGPLPHSKPEASAAKRKG